MSNSLAQHVASLSCSIAALIGVALVGVLLIGSLVSPAVAAATLDRSKK